MTPVGLSPPHQWVVSLCALNSAGVRPPRLMWGRSSDLGLRPVPKPLERQDPELPIARQDREEFFHRCPRYRPLKDEIIAVALCQGAAIHYVNGYSSER